MDRPVRAPFRGGPRWTEGLCVLAFTGQGFSMPLPVSSQRQNGSQGGSSERIEFWMFETSELELLGSSYDQKHHSESY